MNILIAVVGGFASGIFLRSLFFNSWWPVVFVLLLAALIGAFAFARPRLAYSLGAVFFMFCVLGMLRSSLAETSLPKPFLNDLRHRVTYEGVVVSDPDVRDTNQRFQIRVTAADVTTRMLVVAPRVTRVAVGEWVSVSGTLQVPEAFATEGGRVFRYDRYLQRDDVRFILNYAYVRVASEAPPYSLPANLARVKHSFINGIQAVLPEPYSSLASGVVIGGKSGLGSDLQDAFIKSGLIQIIVLSGYNVMIVAEWVVAALALTRLKRHWGALAGGIALLLFVGVAGFSATALRAALMALIALYARATGRTYAAGRALLVVVLAMLIWNPLYLVFDPGFGLSVAATAGLIWLAPIIEMLFVGKAEPAQKEMPRASTPFWVNALATTLAAQIAVLPLLLYETGNLSLVAVPANLLTAPMIPLAMGLSALAGLAGMCFSTIAPVLALALGYPAYLASSYILFIATETAALPYAAVSLPAFPFWLVLLAYTALIALAKRFSTTLQLRFAKNASI